MEYCVVDDANLQFANQFLVTENDALKRIKLIEQGLRRVIHTLAIFSERKSTSPPQAKGEAKPGFEILDVYADRRLTDVKFGLGKRESATPCDGYEDAKEFEVYVAERGR